VAVDKLKEADYLGTNIHELPPAAKAPPSPAIQAESLPAKVPPKATVAPDAWVAAAPAPAKSRPAPPAAPENATSRTNELAMQGPDGEAKARAQIEARVSSGRASADDLRLLRAICKHMGDRGCSDRASSLLAGQK
jgi:hypothetical protein